MKKMKKFIDKLQKAWNKLLYKLMFKKYPDYIKKYISADNSKELGYKKVINTIKSVYPIGIFSGVVSFLIIANKPNKKESSDIINPI